MSEELVVAKDIVVGLAYTLYVDNAIEDSASVSEPLEYIHGHGNLISGLEKELEGMKVGEKKTVTVSPEEGYGEYDPENVIKLERSLFPADFRIGKGVMVPLADDEGHHYHSFILEWDDDSVTVDLNPPMAGKTLVFDCEIVSLRPGTPEEIEAGSIYLSEGGCDCGDCSTCGHDCH